MRKKQAKPAKRPNTFSFDNNDDDDDNDNDEGFVYSRIDPCDFMVSSSSSSSSKYSSVFDDCVTPTSENSIPMVKLEALTYALHNDTLPVKILKRETRESRESREPRDMQCCSYSYANNSPTSYPINFYQTPTRPCSSRYTRKYTLSSQKSSNSLRSQDQNIRKNNLLTVSTGNILITDESSEFPDSESPLKRLERCVQANSKTECLTSKHSTSKPTTSATYYLMEPRTNANSMKFRLGYDSRRTSAADALGELSQLVHRIGTAKLPVPATSNVCIPNSVASNIFTCLKCAQRFDTLDELVLHISTTRHFTRGSTRNPDTLAPWEKDRATVNFDKQLVAPNFLTPLFCTQKCLEVPRDLTCKSADKNASS